MGMFTYVSSIHQCTVFYVNVFRDLRDRKADRVQ